MLIQPALDFHGVQFPSVSFHSLKEKPSEDKVEITFGVKSKLFYKDDPNYFNLIQEIEVKSDLFFDLYIVGVGSFKLNTDDEATKKLLANQTAPAIVYPYLRAFIASLTSGLGVVDPIHLPVGYFNRDEALEVINDINPPGVL